VAVEDTNQRIAEVLEKVPGIRHIDGTPITARDTFNIGASTVMCNDLDIRMLLGPAGERFT
jgi:hypothetical protein